jgi:hypothetical protein
MEVETGTFRTERTHPLAIPRKRRFGETRSHREHNYLLLWSFPEHSALAMYFY